jgi:large subunit ribosomal protein L25
MSETYTLDVETRLVKGKQVRQLRRDNLVPAVIYGAGGEALSVSCPRRPLEILLSKAGGTHLVKLNVSGSPEDVLVRTVQRHPIRRSLIHVDFLRVDLTKTIKAEVPFSFINEPKLATELALAHYVTQIEVECLPGDIPAHVVVDLSKLRKAGDQITVGSLPAMKSVTYLADASDVIVRVESSTTGGGAGAEAEVEAIVAEPEISAAKGKKDEDA